MSHKKDCSLVHLFDQPERGVSDEEGQGEKNDAGDNHHPGEGPQRQLTPKQDSVQVSEKDCEQPVKIGNSPQVWCQCISGCKGASPADSCNLGDVKTDCWSDDTHGGAVEETAEEEEGIAGRKGEDGGCEDHHCRTQDKSHLARVSVHKETSQQIPNHLHR